MTTMRAALYRGPGQVRIEETAVPEPGPGEVLVQVHAAGICGTDAGEFVTGPHWYRLADGAPHIPGHEFAGQIVAVGPGASRAHIGQLVACAAVVPCYDCPACRDGRVTVCDRLCVVGGQRPGALAEFCAVPEATCHPLGPRDLPAALGALAQPLGVAVHAWSRGAPAPGARVLIVGAGAIGMLLTAVSSGTDADVTVCDVHPGALKAAAVFGPAHLLDLSKDREIRTGTFDVVFECSGKAAGWRTASQAVQAGGRLVVVGHQNAPVELDALKLSLREIDLAGTNALNPDTDFAVALTLLDRQREIWLDLVPDPISLDRLVPDGLIPLSAGHATATKTLIDPRL